MRIDIAEVIKYSKASADRNRRKGGSQSISKCARKIGRAVSQFLNVYGQVSQFLKTKCTEIGPDAYKVGRRVPIYIKRPGSAVPLHMGVCCVEISGEMGGLDR